MTREVYAILGLAGDEEKARLTEYVIRYCNAAFMNGKSGDYESDQVPLLAFMDKDKNAGVAFQKELAERHCIKLRIVNAAHSDMEGPREADADLFFFHGSWESAEDVGIYTMFLAHEYGRLKHKIVSSLGGLTVFVDEITDSIRKVGPGEQDQQDITWEIMELLKQF